MPLPRRGGGGGTERPAAPAPARRGRAALAAGGLAEPDPAVADFRLGLQERILHGGEGDLAPSELDPGDADPALPELAVVDDLAVVDLDPGLELVRLAEHVVLLQRLKVVDAVGRRVVVVG